MDMSDDDQKIFAAKIKAQENCRFILGRAAP